MTGKRTLMVIAASPEAAAKVISDYDWGIARVVWIGPAIEQVVFGLIDEAHALYEISVVFRWSS